MNAPLLQALDLQRTFGPTVALQQASASVDAGEVLAILGASGSGKSTLLHCLAGILRPDAGSVRYGDTDLLAASDAERSRLRREEFGFVFQFGQLVPELSCLENVALPLMLAGARRRTITGRARDWLATLGVEDVADHRPGEVSGGQGQRVAVARAMVTNPKVIFADEPTGALDSLAGEQVMDLLVDSARDRGCAVVLVTHEARIAAYADREIVVRDGRCDDYRAKHAAGAPVREAAQ